MVLFIAVAGWPAPAVALSGSIVLGFASPYSAPDGSTCTHRGVDVVLPGGAPADAPRSGTVRFAGRVPGPHGGSVLAVTLETADGMVTMLPLAELAVTAGDRVAAGDRIGAVAPVGDPSSPVAHLHLGLKRGDVYIDPAGLLAAPPTTQPQPKPEAAPAPKAVPAAAPSPVVVAGASAPAPSGATASTGLGSSVSQPLAVGDSVDPAGGELPQGVTLADSAAVPEVGVRVRSSSAVPNSIAVDRRGASSSRRWSSFRPAVKAGLVAVFASALSAAMFLLPLLITRRAIATRVVEPPVSDRLGTMLQHLKAGDTLRGLTSCSGPTAFTVPEPPAQRR